MPVPSQNRQPSPGMPCPECGFFIEMSIESLLYKPAFTCPGCLLEISLDRPSSQQALELLQKVNLAKGNIEKAKNFER
ncbi:phage terminase large subunit family protein [Ancylothrix sp. C2]|uniref:phage terminase large subunit family protein n=1 Tax=Ancylothrix sp. D3o TaxID=2953691 RepID=UPI0021BA70A0|nr:phage terminase large subunit family protein [Ancylothrix sp. D3o]MCT7953207.1 phage terminase large subunit family protein [Ancylothrix sp. D3o]